MPDIDYDKLASQHGGKVVDYDSLAAEVQAQSVAAPQSTAPQGLMASIGDRLKAAAHQTSPMRVVEGLGGAGLGGIVGGTIGTVLGGPVGGIAGASIGGAGGEGWNQIVNRVLGREAPGTATEAAGQIAKQGAIQGATQATGAALGAGMSKAAPWLMQKALKPTQAVLEEYRTTAPKLVKSLLDEGISVTQGGVDKLQRLLKSVNSDITDALKSRDSLLERLGLDPAVVDKRRVAARTLETAGRLAKQTNPTSALNAIGETTEEFLNHPIYPGNLRLPEAQAMKVGTYEQIGKKYGELSSASVEAQKALARGLKEEIAAELPQIADLNARDARLLAALDATGRRVAMSNNRDPVGFAWVAQHPVTFLAALFDRSPAVKSMLARGMYTSAAKAARVTPEAIRIAVGAIAQQSSPDSGGELPRP